MQAPLKLFLVFACASLSAALALAQPATEKKAPAKVGAPKPAQPKAAEVKATEPKLKASATTAARPDAEPAPTPAAKPSPAPRPPAEEVQHTARYDAAIAATRNHPVSAEDTGRIRDAVKAIAEADLAKGKALRDQIKDPAGRKLIDWYLYRGGYGTAAEIRAFMLANPAWPDRERLNQRAEEALFNSNASPREVKAFFAETPPATGVGMAALASALAADKDEAAAKVLAAKAWVEYAIPAVAGTEFPQEGRLSAHGERPQAPPRPPAAERQPLGRRAQRTRRRHPPGHPAALGARAEEGAGAPRGVPARQEFRATDGQAAAARAQDRMGPCHPARASAAPAEEARGGLGDSADRAGRHAAREARRLVGGAACRRLRCAQGRQGEDRL